MLYCLINTRGYKTLSEFSYLSEEEKLSDLISRYCYLELNDKLTRKQASLFFYRYVSSQFFTEEAKNRRPPKDEQLKQLFEVRKRYFNAFKGTKNVSEAVLFYDYFYQKFLPEIKEQRLIRSGVSYSTKSKDYVTANRR